MLNPALVQIREALAQVPYIAHITNRDDYERALELMDEPGQDRERFLSRARGFDRPNRV
ncbi:hypothetical protein ABR859_21265 [Aeromonas caviae]|uniref:hypothetical protein n=1 Tax=Aeromonas caviae TaxID=648 RepID=UPI0033061C29